MSSAVQYILIAALAYLIGSVSVGQVVSKIFHGPNLRKVGSGSTGASNVLRTMGTKYGLMTLFGDFAKAVLSCAIAWWTIGTIEAAMLAGLACILGHNWPIFFKMEGGKGVAASCGVALMTFPVAGAISILTCLAVIAIWRFISLGSMVLVTLFALLVTIFYAHGNWLIIIWAWIVALLCIYRHHGNINRLLHGKERKIGQKEPK
ncbi:MAG: glycerol-3-phosphate 1-O-acyltransferase PlsY [Clostridiales bacterium]|nr:glycerol-3-phosphate 1-O-acyltransferase PlsY [Clostridiales bacterium]